MRSEFKTRTKLWDENGRANRVVERIRRKLLKHE